MAKDILNMKSACAYIRVSTDKQEELSPDAQKRLLIDFAKKNNMSLLASNIYPVSYTHLTLPTIRLV